MPHLRLADVRLWLFRPGVLIAAVSAVRATQLPRPWLYPLWWLAVAILPIRLRVGATVLVGATLAFLVVVPANHIWFGFWIAATFVLFADRERQQFVVRWQLTILYAFTGISKLTPQWLSGRHLQDLLLDKHDILIPATVALLGAIAIATVECGLAWMLWRPRLRRVVLVVAGTAHLSIWLGLGNPIQTAPALFFFNGLAFAMLAWSTCAGSYRSSGNLRSGSTAVGALADRD